jgi:hypothetical protein
MSFDWMGEYDAVVSLGATCTTAWQAQRHFPGSPAFPLDWRVVSFDALLHLVETDFAPMIDTSAYEITADGKNICLQSLGITFPHEFRREGGQITSSWKDTLPTTVSKFAHLVERWRALIEGPVDVLFLRHTGHYGLGVDGHRLLKDAEVSTLCDLLERKAPRLNFRILFLSATAGKITHPRAHAAAVRFANAEDWPSADDRWKGATAAWGALFEGVRLKA